MADMEDLDRCGITPVCDCSLGVWKMASDLRAQPGQKMEALSGGDDQLNSGQLSIRDKYASSMNRYQQAMSGTFHHQRENVFGLTVQRFLKSAFETFGQQGPRVRLSRRLAVTQAMRDTANEILRGGAGGVEA